MKLNVLGGKEGERITRRKNSRKAPREKNCQGKVSVDGGAWVTGQTQNPDLACKNKEEQQTAENEGGQGHFFTNGNAQTPRVKQIWVGETHREKTTQIFHDWKGNIGKAGEVIMPFKANAPLEVRATGRPNYEKIKESVVREKKTKLDAPKGIR